METRKIGVIEVTVVGVGCNNYGNRMEEGDSIQTLHAALDAGINFFDTANKYGGGRSEAILGRAVATRRDEVVLATKVGAPRDAYRMTREYVREECEGSLKRLGVDVIDLYQLHWPDPLTPIEETLAAMNELIDEGKVREIGCSNFSLEQLREANAAAAAAGVRGFASVQNEYNLLHRVDEASVLAECRATGVAYLPFKPFCNGLLTGKYRRNVPYPNDTRITTLDPARQAEEITEEKLQKVEALAEYAESKGHSMLELVIGHMLADPAIPSVIAGASRPSQPQANVDAAAAWTLTTEDLGAVDRASRG